MNCPVCGENSSDVIDSRPQEDTVRRRRECPKCKHRWTTYEYHEDYGVDRIKILLSQFKKEMIDHINGLKI